MRKQEVKMAYQKPTMIQASDHCAIEADEIVWYVVAIIVLAAIALSLIAAMLLFCEFKGMSFGGYYEVLENRRAVKIGCI